LESNCYARESFKKIPSLPLSCKYGSLAKNGQFDKKSRFFAITTRSVEMNNRKEISIYERFLRVTAKPAACMFKKQGFYRAVPC
jgi:hypothetical protein